MFLMPPRLRPSMHAEHEAYIAATEGEHRRTLELLHAEIRACAPDAEEVIRVRVPAFLHRGKPLASIGDARRHVSLYLMYGGVIAEFDEELAAYDRSRTVIRFDPAEDLPRDLIARMITRRVEQIDEALG